VVDNIKRFAIQFYNATWSVFSFFCCCCSCWLVYCNFFLYVSTYCFSGLCLPYCVVK